MGAKENLPMLGAVVESQDKLLEEAIAEAVNQKTPMPNITFSGSHNSGFQLGNNAGTISSLRWGGTA